MNNTKKNVRPSVKERIREATREQWIKFTLIAIVYLLFVIWVQNFWLLAGILVIFDIYISRIIQWGAWKRSNNVAVRKIADWVDAIVFALVAVYIINILIFQNYKIPSSSLEKTLLVGDYLFVSKVSYGPRIPNTPLAFPLTHHTLPILNIKSYSDWPHWDYKRLKGFGHVKRGDIVVFNFPAGDTVALKVQNPDYYDLVYNRYSWDWVHSDKNTFGDIVYRPVDRRENYVKRCIGMPGDTLQIINNVVYINGAELPAPKKVQFAYFVETQGNLFTEKQFRKLDVSRDEQFLYNRMGEASLVFDRLGIERNEKGDFNPVYRIPLTQEALRFLEKSGWAKSIRIEPAEFGGPTYPYGYITGWNRDNFGPLWIPKKGETIVLNERNLALYTRCIVNYEGNTLRKNENKIFINGIPANSYTFRYDYYFMMGDNRHNSLDSRCWGFVPEDHIVGKPLLIWLSIDKDRDWLDGKIRWNRIFTGVSGK